MISTSESISLGNNQLRELQDISKLRKLRYLHLQHNHLTEFPGSILELKQLEELDVSNKLITEFPDAIRALKDLNFIHLTCIMQEIIIETYKKLEITVLKSNSKSAIVILIISTFMLTKLIFNTLSLNGEYS